MWISPSFQSNTFKDPKTDEKILIFEDRIFGWKLNIADLIINGKKRSDGSFEREPIPGSGFAALDIVFSYFEMIAKYKNGYIKNYKSKEYTRRGLIWVFPYLKQPQIPTNNPGVQGKVVSLVDYVLDIMYEGIRCGLYHGGTINGRVILTGDTQVEIAFDIQKLAILINPHLFVPALKVHFASYIYSLKDQNNLELRGKFETRYNYDQKYLV